MSATERISAFRDATIMRMEIILVLVLGDTKATDIWADQAAHSLSWKFHWVRIKLY